LATDGKRIAFATADGPRPRLWIASLDHSAPPRSLPVEWCEMPRFVGDYIYYLAREGNAQAGTGLVVHRIRPDGTGDERIQTREFWRAAFSPSGRHVALTTRHETETSVFRLNVVDWQTGASTPVCTG